MIVTFTGNNNLGGTLQNISTAISSATACGITVSAATASLCRNQTIDFSFGPGGAPNSTDCSILYDVSRITALGTGTGVTPTSPDPTPGVVARTVIQVNQTALPTFTAASSLYFQGFSQRASQRIMLREDEFMVGPATNLAGFGFRAYSTNYASPIAWDVKFNDVN